MACLVFLDDQFAAFERDSGMQEDKVIGILRKTWAKMSERGREMARGIALEGRAREVMGKALAG